MSAKERQRGFTLIEVLVATVILSVGMMGGLGMLLAGQSAAAAGDRLTRASALAREVLEEKIAVPFSELLGKKASGEDRPGDFVREWAVEPDVPRPGMAMIHVWVSWKGGTGKIHRLELGAARAQGLVP
jgi:prepilin-type N-terminal cleavage/methylation domain-containing protein